jgi:hypothetical protein
LKNACTVWEEEVGKGLVNTEPRWPPTPPIAQTRGINGSGSGCEFSLTNENRESLCQKKSPRKPHIVPGS